MSSFFFLKKTKRRFLIHFTNTICISISFVFRSKKPVGVRSERSTISSNDCTYQSAKRQRLENGHLNKVWYSFQAEMRGLPNFDVLFFPCRMNLFYNVHSDFFFLSNNCSSYCTYGGKYKG